MESPEIIGEEPLHAGRGNFHATLDSVVHSTGRFSAVPIPVPSGPRQAGHSMAAEESRVEMSKEQRMAVLNFILGRRLRIGIQNCFL